MSQWSLLYPVCKSSCEAVEKVCLYKENNAEGVVMWGDNEQKLLLAITALSDKECDSYEHHCPSLWETISSVCA